jgi:hypothetical protein
MQESFDYYDVCQHTERNKGLYTADQNVRRNDRRGTRQNPNGNRHGFECPEVRPSLIENIHGSVFFCPVNLDND